jgi:hypothetical protein
MKSKTGLKRIKERVRRRHDSKEVEDEVFVGGGIQHPFDGMVHSQRSTTSCIQLSML